jgi:hypothetical protein
MKELKLIHLTKHSGGVGQLAICGVHANRSLDLESYRLWILERGPYKIEESCIKCFEHVLCATYHNQTDYSTYLNLYVY